MIQFEVGIYFLLGGALLTQPHRPSRRTIVVFSALAVILAAGWFVLGKTTFLSRTAYIYAKPLIEKKLNAKFNSTPFEGNPFTGFVVKDVALSQNGTEKLTAKEMRVTIALGTTCVNFSPKLNLEVFDARTSIEKFSQLLPKSKKKEATDIIINTVKLNNSHIETQAGLLNIDSGSINIENSQSYSANADTKFEDLAEFKLKGAIKKVDGNWTAKGLQLISDNGKAEVNGALFPVADAKIETHNLNLSKIAAVFPKARALGIRGMLTSDFTFKQTGNNAETKGTLSLNNALIHGIPIETLSVKWDYDKGLFKSTFNDTGADNSALTGYVNFDARNKNSYLDMDVSTAQLKLATLTDQFKEQLGGITLLPEGTITGAKIKLKGYLSALTGNVEILPSDISYGGMAFKKLGGVVVFNGTQKGDVNFSALHNGKPVTLKGVLAFAPNTPTNIRLSATGFKVEEFYKALPMLQKQNTKGSVALDAVISGTPKHWKMDAKLSSAQLTADKIGTIQNLSVNAAYLLENHNISVKNLSAIWNGAKLSASGSYDNTKLQPAISCSGNFSGMQTERFYELLKFMAKIRLNLPVNGHFTAKGTASDPIIEANLSSSSGTIMKGQPINSASAKLIYRNGKITAEPLTLITPQGTLKSRVDAIPTGEKTWSWEAAFDKLGMGILNGVFGMNQDIRGKASGKIKFYGNNKQMQWDAKLDASRFMWRTFRFDSFLGSLNGTKDSINLNNVQFEFCKGKGNADGTVKIGNTLDTSNLNVDISASKINMYEVIRRHLPQIRNIQGFAQAGGKVTGSIENPKFNGTAMLAPMRIGMAYIPEAKTDIAASLSKIRFDNISIRFPEGSAGGKAFLGNKNGKWHTAFKLDGEKINLTKLLAFAPDSVHSSISGSVNLTLDAKCPLDSLTVNGKLVADTLQIKGLSLENLRAPFYYTDNYLVVEDFRVNSHSGEIFGGFAYNTKNNFWGARCEAKQLNIAPAFENLYGKDKPGKITGKADMKLRVGGESMQLSNLNAAGTLTAIDGEISGFKFLDSAKKFTKGKPVRFSKVQSAFRFDNGTLILLPGTQAVAPAGDPVYRMAMLDGMITSKGDLSLLCLGKFNIRALNSILGGVTGLVDMSKTITTKGINNIDSKELLQNVLGGVLGGATRSSFRFVSIGLGGTLKSPKLTKLVVESDARRKNKGTTIPVSPSDPEDKRLKQDGDITFNLHFEVPVGYGKSSEPGDFAGQVMQDTLKSLISNITF